MLNIGPQELFIILVIALLVVGPQRLPALGRSIGRGLRELRKAQDEVKRTIQVNLDDEPPNGSSATPAPARGAATGSADGRATDPKPRATGAPDPTPTASEPLPADEIRNISRSLGRSLAELRRAKEEVQRSFRIDVAPTTKPSSRSGRNPRRRRPRRRRPTQRNRRRRRPSATPRRPPNPRRTDEPATSDRATD